MINTKLVINQNVFNNNRITLLFKQPKEGKFSNMFFFLPIADIYYDYQRTELIMPKGNPVLVFPKLFYTDIIESRKYKGFYVTSPYSDVELIFKEFYSTLTKKNIWILTYDKMTLYEYTYFEEAEPDEDTYDMFYYLNGTSKKIFLSKHRIIEIETNKIMDNESSNDSDYWKDGEDELRGLFEEAGYDFTD